MINFIVIPCWNEEKNIRSVIEKVKPYGRIVVVDDCSTDNSYEIAKQQDVAVLRHMINCGQGAALRTGTKYAVSRATAERDVIIHFDADGQMQARDLPRLAEVLFQGQADLVFGSRFLDNTSRLPATKKYFIMPVARAVNRLFLDIKLTDPQSGFRAMTVAVARQLDWSQDRMAHCSEILALAHQGGWTIKEVPVTVLYHQFGQSFGGGWRIVKDLFLNNMLR